jgi:hypothetical protein
VTTAGIAGIVHRKAHQIWQIAVLDASIQRAGDEVGSRFAKEGWCRQGIDRIAIPKVNNFAVVEVNAVQHLHEICAIA